MATTTPNYHLRKPTNADTVNVATDISNNMDLLDAHAHSGTYVAYLTGLTDSPTVDNAPAIQAALTAAGATDGNGRHGGVVILPPYSLGIASTLVIPDRVRLLGTSRSGTKLMAITGFTGSYMVQLGVNGTEAFGSRLEFCFLECNSIAGLGGIYSRAAEEQSGPYMVTVNNYRTYAVLYEGNRSGARTGYFASSPEVVDFHAFPSASGSTDGVLFDGVSNVSKIERIEVGDSLRAGTNTAGIHILNSDVHVSSYHVEKHTDGVLFDTGATGTVTGAFGHSTVTNVVHLAAGNNGGVVLNDIFLNGSTKSLLDEVTSRDSVADLTFFMMQSGSFKSVISSDPLHTQRIFGSQILSGRVFNSRSTGQTTFGSNVTGDANDRVALTTDAGIQFGDGTAVADTNLYRSAADTLKTDDALIIGTPGTAAGSAATINGTQTLTNKTISGGSNTLSAIPESAVTNLTADLAAKAADNTVLHLAGIETVTGAKTFSAAVAVSAGLNVVQNLKTGLYYFTTATTSTGTSATLGNGTARATPFLVPQGLTVTKIGAEVTVIGDVGSKIRLGIYADDGTGYPGALVLDAGTIAGDSATVQEITVSQALAAGLYWVVGVVQVVTVTQPTLRVISTNVNQMGLPSIPAAAAAPVSYNQTGVTGALGTPFTATPVSGGSAPRIFVKVGSVP